jgi:hypothetical protein
MFRAEGDRQQADIYGSASNTTTQTPEELTGSNFPALQVRDYNFILVIICPVIG